MSSKAIPAKYFLKRLYLGARSIFIRLLVRRSSITAADPDMIRSILVIRMDRIGDVVVSLPAIEALQTIFPAAKISVLVHPSCAPLVQGLPYITETIPYEGFWRTVRHLKEHRFDMAVDLLMDYSIRTALIAYLSRSPVRAGFDIEGRGRFFTIAVTPDGKEKHMSEYVRDIARAVARVYKVEGRADWCLPPRLTISSSAAAAADELLANGGIGKNDRIITIHPGGHFPSQCWMPGSFAELAASVAEKHNAKIVIIGSSAERELAEGIAALMNVKPLVIVGTPIDVAAAVIAVSDLLICNNSGPLHIATALGTPTVSTMGPTVPYLWWPLGPENTVVRHGMPCSPCSVGACERHDCMKLITVAEMEEAVAYRLAFGALGGGEHQRVKLKKANTETILVINLGGIGDVILSTPALRALKSAYPGSKIYFLGVKRIAEFVKKLPNIDGVFEIDLQLSFMSVMKNLKMLRYIRSLKIGLAINMRTLVSKAGALKIRLLLALIGAKVTAGRDTEGAGKFFDIRIPESRRGDKSEMEYDLDMVRALGCNGIMKHPDFDIGSAETGKVRSMLASHGVAERDLLIGIHPGGKPSHRWSAQYFASVIDRISAETQAKFIITGDRSDSAAARKVIEYSKTALIDTTGALNLAELGALIKRCDLYICNDTASMHIASVLGTPLVAIFGPGYLKRFDPRTLSKNAIVITQEIACAPCDRVNCNTMECLRSISPDMVFTAAQKILHKDNRI